VAHHGEALLELVDRRQPVEVRAAHVVAQDGERFDPPVRRHVEGRRVEGIVDADVDPQRRGQSLPHLLRDAHG